MDDVTGKASAPNPLVTRIKAILLKPDAEWPVIAAEADSPGSLITRYALPLAAISPVAGFLRGQLFGYGAFGISYKPGLVAGISAAIVAYVLNVVGIIVLALIADWLAPKFAGTANRTNAFKLVVYGSTAAWLAGAFQLIPGLGILGLAGVYSLYLYYTGAAPLMQVPKDKAVGFTAVTIVCAVALYLVVGAVSGAFLTMFGGGAASSFSSTDGGTVSGKLAIPGVGSIDVDKAQQAATAMQDSANGKKPAVDPTKLQALLPAAIGAYVRNAVEANALGGMGSEAEGTYAAGDKSFSLKVTDMAAMGALAGIGSAMGVSNSRQDADGYEKTGTVDGHMQSEKWNNSSKNGKFSVMVGNRFMIEADGSAGSIDELKTAVASIDQNALAGLVN
ncbi:MAG: Yip1 family protein [Novosphingobium sp.]